MARTSATRSVVGTVVIKQALQRSVADVSS
jgi:hypothetical protein